MTSSPKATPSSSSGWNPRTSPQSSTVGGTPTHSMTENVSPDMRGKKPMSLDPNRYDPTLDAKLALLADVHCRLTQDMSAFTSNFQHALCELGRTFESGFQGLGSAQAAQATTQAIQNSTLVDQLRQPRPSSTLCPFKVEFPVYNGTGDFESWKKQVDRLFRAHKIDPTSSDALAWTFLHLRGSALTYAENEDPADLPALLRLLQQRFQPADEAYDIRARLNRLRQNGSEYEQYYRRFSDLAARAPDLSDADAQFFFKQGLPATVRAEILYKQATTLQQCQEIARSFQLAHVTAQTSASRAMELDSHFTLRSRRPQRFAHRDRNRHSHSRSSHSSSHRSHSSGSHSRTSSNSRVRFHLPHRSARSPRTPPRSSPSTVVAPATPSSASKTSVCYFCGKPGHIRRDCHAYAKSRSHRGPSASSPHSPRAPFAPRSPNYALRGGRPHRGRPLNGRGSR